MRTVLHAFLPAAMLLLSACSSMKSGGKSVPGQQTRWDGQTNATSMVAYLNENARLIPAVRSEDVTVEFKQGRDSGNVSAKLACEKPRNFRLTGQVVGQPMVDLGSNDKEFWFWISKANPPYVHHASHDALARGGVRMPFPFQPDMILTALGMGEYDPNKKYEVKTNGNTVELIETVMSPAGRPIQKSTVFNRNRRGDQPTVAGHLLRDEKGHKVCEATITHVKRDPRTGAELPWRVQFVWPDQQVEMKMRLDDVHVTSADPQTAQTLYSRRNLAQFRSFDLERGTADAPEGQVQRVGDPPR